MMNIILGIFIIISVILLIKYTNLKSSYDFLKKKNTDTENALSVYFNMVIQYRDVIIKNNLTVPGDINYTGNINNIKDNTNKYSVDSILDEIAEKGIDNVSEDKLNFLRNKQDDNN